MEFLNTWLQGIIVAVVIASIIQMILPSGNNKKYVKVVLGVYVVFQIITPVINKFWSSDFELSSLIDIDKYTQKMETYEISSKNTDINKLNEDSIKQIYISNLKTDIKTKLEDKGYLVENIEIQAENNESYDIKKLTISIKGKNDRETKSEKEEDKIHINEISKIEIKVGENNEKHNFNTSEEINEKSNISNEDKRTIKEYLTSVYEINEKQITIY